jgi:hypothetical protein
MSVGILAVDDIRGVCGDGMAATGRPPVSIEDVDSDAA